MWYDIRSFFFLFIACTAGYGTTLYGLYATSTLNDSLSSPMMTMYTLFTAATGTNIHIHTYNDVYTNTCTHHTRVRQIMQSNNTQCH